MDEPGRVDWRLGARAASRVPRVFKKLLSDACPSKPEKSHGEMFEDSNKGQRGASVHSGGKRIRPDKKKNGK